MLLKDNLFRINFNDIYKAIYPFSLIIIFMYLSIILYNFYNINVWRHDCIRYITSYQIQLQSEGRWLVYTLFDALRLLNPTFVGILNIIFIYIFLYISFRNILDIKISVLAAMVSILVPSIYMINLWPLVSTCAFMLLVIASLLHNKINYVYFFLFFGILFNGTLSNFYFLLPLLFINNKNFIKILLLWILGFLIGYIISNCIVYYICGTFITLSEWRQPHVVSSIADLILSIKKETNYFIYHLTFFKNSLWIFPFAFLFCVLKNIKKTYKQIIVILSVTLSVYAQAIPYTLAVSTRTIIPFFIGLIFLFFFAFNKHRITTSIFSIIFASIFFVHTYNNITYYKTINDIWYRSFNDLNIDLDIIDSLVMLSSDEDIAKNEFLLAYRHKISNISDEGLGTAFRWRA